MSLSKIAQYKRKRKFYDGGGGGDAEGPNGPDGGYNGGDNNFGADYGGNEVGESVSGTAAEHAGTNVGVNAGEVGESVSGTAAEHAGPGANTDAQDAANLAAFDASQPSGLASLAGFGTIGNLLAGLDKANVAMNSGKNYGATYAGGVQVGGREGSGLNAGGDRRNNGDGPDHRAGPHGGAIRDHGGRAAAATHSRLEPAHRCRRLPILAPATQVRGATSGTLC